MSSARHYEGLHEHPCPLPRPRFWRRGRSWICTCGKEWWLVEKFHNDDIMDMWSEWFWVAGTAPIAEQLSFQSWERS